MSDAADTQDRTESSTRRNDRRGGRGSGRGGGRGRGRGRGSSRLRSAGGEDGDDNGERRQYPPTIPVPVEMMGTVVTGKITDLVRRGRGQFGFILIGDGPRTESPRIYFNFKDYSDPKFPPRRGYLVELLCSEDDEKRPYATNVKLTELGQEEAEAREEEYKKKQASGEGVKRNGRIRRERREIEDDDRTVTLRVTCDDKDEVIELAVKVNQSIGKLKYNAVEEFGVTPEYSVFCNITPENPEGDMLNRTLLSEMADGDAIHLRNIPK